MAKGKKGSRDRSVVALPNSTGCVVPLPYEDTLRQLHATAIMVERMLSAFAEMTAPQLRQGAVEVTFLQGKRLRFFIKLESKDLATVDVHTKTLTFAKELPPGLFPGILERLFRKMKWNVA